MVGTNNITILTSNYSWLYDLNDISKYKETIVTNKEIKTRNKKKTESKILYQIFVEIQCNNNDPFWKEIFESASIGKFQKGIKLKNNSLIYKNKNKIFTQELDMENAQICEMEFISFMNEKVGLFSPLDISKKKEALDKIKITESKIEFNSWSQIKKQCHKNMLISNFIDDYISEGKNLTSFEKTQLQDTIILGILCGYFNINTIIVLNNKIENIVGLVKLDNGLFGFDKSIIKIKNIKYKESKEKEDCTLMSCSTNGKIIEDNLNTNINLHKKWSKWVSVREKRILRYKKNS